MNPLTVVSILLFGLAVVQAPEEQPGAAGGDTPPGPPPVKLSPVGEEGEEARPGAVRARIDELRQAAERADGPGPRVDLQLAAANLVLAELTEPAASRYLVGCPEAGDAEAVTAAVREAEALLDEAAGNLLKATAIEGIDEAWAARSTRRLDSLKAFASVLVAVLAPKAGDEATLDERRAAAKLSFLLEDPDGSIAAAARLWQACIRLRHGERDQVLSMLAPALAELPRDYRHTAFFQRLLRCRALAGQGSHATAMALLIQMEERVDGWFLRQQRPDDARRAVYYTELQILRSWHDRLSGDSQKAEREWILSQMHRIRIDHFDSQENAVTRLVGAIPILAQAP